MRLLIITILGVGLMSCKLLRGDQDIAVRDVPSVVKNAFDNTFPKATDIEWEKAEDNFEAEFELKNIDHTVLISSAGNIVMQKQEIALDELPEDIQATIQQDFADKEIDGAEKIEKGGKVYYQVEFEGFFSDDHKVFAANGQKVENFRYWD